MIKKSNADVTAWYARLSFPKVWKPEPIMLQGKPTGDPKYSCTVVLENDEYHAGTIKHIHAEEERMIAESWPDGVPDNLRRALQWGPTAHPKDANLTNAWVLHAYAAATSQPQVGVYYPATGVFTAWTPEQGQAKVYSGAEAHVGVGLFTYEYSQFNLGVGVGLNMVWMTGREMSRFDSKMTASVAFGGGPSGNAPPAAVGAPAADAPPVQQGGGFHAGPATDDGAPF